MYYVHILKRSMFLRHDQTVGISNQQAYSMNDTWLTSTCDP